MEQGIYVHIPYCLAKCRYCSFNSYPTDGSVPPAYVDALVDDIMREAQTWSGTGGERFATVYLGGGTPSLLSIEQVAAILGALRKGFPIGTGTEVTVECNPRTVDCDRMRALVDLGVTRASIGVQSLADGELRFLGRPHTSAEALVALEDAADAGFRDVSADVMIGLPGQKRRALARTLEAVVDLVTHLSVYILSVEAGTALERDVSQGSIVMPGDEVVADLYSFVREYLACRGLPPYEISNYARPGCRCRHNEIYWQRGNYVGVGAGAHAHRDGWRCSRIAEPRAYMAALAAGSSPVAASEDLTPGQMLLEEIMLAMRTERGASLSGLACRYGLARGELEGAMAGLLKEGHVATRGDCVALSPKGVLLADAVIAEMASSITGAAPDSC